MRHRGLALLLLVGGCGVPRDAAPRPDTVAAVSRPVPAAPPDSAIPDTALVVYYNALAHVLASRGTLLDSTSDTVRNDYDTTHLDTLRAYHYQNLNARYLVFAGARRNPMLLGVTLFAPLKGLPFDINVGASGSAILARFGRPSQDTVVAGVRTIQYEVGDEATDNVFFRLRGDVLFEIEWAPYYD